MKLVPWAAILATIIAVALIIAVILGKLPWAVAAAFISGSLLPVLKGGAS